jgi:hypothetical protein
MASPNPSDGIAGFFNPVTDSTDAGYLAFVFRALMNGIATTMPVQVLACTNTGGIELPGTVDVKLLVNQIDGDGNVHPRGTIFSIPYARQQAGANALIIDPEPGDIGFCVFASHDISSVKANKGQANPGSHRRFSYSDGIYAGSIFGVTAPSNLIQISGGQITIQSPGTVTINAPSVKTTADLEVGGNLKVDGATELIGTVTADANVHAKANLTADGTVSLGGGAKAVKLSDNSNATKVNAT